MKRKKYKTKSGKPIRLWQGDCHDLMGGKPENHWDLAIVDPPFGIGNFVQTTGNKRGKEVEWNDSIPNKEYFKALRKASNNRIIFGANYYNCFDNIGGAIVWVKNQPMPNFSKAVIASCSYHKKIEVYEQTWTNFVNTKETAHPCEMPVDIFRWILQNYAKDGDRILDTHGGSMSLAIACYMEDYELDIIELDEDYYMDAVERFEQHISQKTLF